MLAVSFRPTNPAMRPFIPMGLDAPKHRPERPRAMKNLVSLFVAALLSATSYAADQLPLFNATLSTGKDHRFVLVSPAGKSSQFLRLGDSFEGYVLKSYDAKAAALTIERDGKSSILNLVADAAVTNAPVVTPATVADATALLDAMNFEEMLDKTMAGLRKQQGAAMGQMINRMAPPGADQETKDAVSAFQKKVMEEMMAGLTGADLKTDVAKIYSEVFTKEELQGLGTFYQSPMGKAFSDKQPELTEKMNAVIMTRMMGAMPRVQQMMQQFGGEMRAKQQAKAAGGATAPGPGPAPTPQPAK